MRSAVTIAALALSVIAAHAEGGEPNYRLPASVQAAAPRADLDSVARRYLNKTASDLRLPRSLWCADFTNLVRKEAGLRPVPSRLARDQVKGGQRISTPVIGAIVVLSRGRSWRSGHTGIVSGLTPDGDPVIISGNHNRRVAEAVYPRSRVIAYVAPN